MNTTMVRVTPTTLWKLRLVKKNKGAKSYDALISDLLDNAVIASNLPAREEEEGREGV